MGCDYRKCEEKERKEGENFSRGKEEVKLDGEKK